MMGELLLGILQLHAQQPHVPHYTQFPRIWLKPLTGMVDLEYPYPEEENSPYDKPAGIAKKLCAPFSFALTKRGRARYHSRDPPEITRSNTFF